MEKYTKILAILLVISICITCMNISTFASTEFTEKEHTFTKTELACAPDYSLVTQKNSSEKFIKIKKIQGKNTNGNTIYYIIECNDGFMLTSSSSGLFSRTRYNNGGTNYIREWIFTEYGNGSYIIYSSIDNSKCLTVDPDTKIVSLSSYTGSEFQRWEMYYSAGGNTLIPATVDSRISGYKLVINSTSCAVSNTTYTPIGFFDVSWYVPMIAVSYHSFYLAPKQTKYVTLESNPSNAFCATNWISWATSNPSVFTVNDFGHACGRRAGTATLTFVDKITRKSGQCIVTVTEISNGTYFLKNKQNSNFAKVKNGIMSAGQNVVQYDFDGDMSEQWIFTLNSNTGYYSIKSANSSELCYYMTVSGNSLSLDEPIVIRSATETTLVDGMKWKIEKTSSGAYKIIPKTGEANDYVLATSTSLGTNNVNLIQGDYILNNSYRDEWLLFDITKKYSQVSLDYSGASAFNANVKQYYESNANAKGSTFTSISKSNFISEMKNSTYFGGMLHGGEYENKLKISSNEVLYLSEISSLSNVDFSSVKIIILTSCYSGRTNGFVDTLCAKGVDVVIGFKGQVEQETSAFWTDRLIYALTQGNTVQYSIDYANAELEEEYSGSYYADCRSLIRWGLYTGTSDLNSTPCL